MTERHPGGISMTRHLIDISGIPFPDSTGSEAGSSPFRVLDMGAGDGHTVRLLRNLGFDAEGIDLSPGPDTSDLPIRTGDFLHCPFPDETFDAICSECAFFVSKDARLALKEASRLLKKNGLLLLADVSFTDSADYIHTLEDAGFSVLKLEDITPLWKEYYISCIWDGTVDQLCGCFPKGKCSYYLTICERM